MATRISSRVFVGRQNELTVLAATLAQAREASSGAVLIAGEAGVGKTRLVSELRRMSIEFGLAWGAGGCVALGEGALPFGPVAAAMHSLLTGVDDAALRALLGQRARDLVRILPGLAERLPGLEPSDSDEWFRARLFESVVTSIEALAARMPLVLVFEDLHWADPGSLDLIAFLIRSPRRGRALVVATYRSDELHRRHPLLPWLAEIGRLDDVERVQLERLDDDEVAAQIAGILDAHPRSGLVDEIRRRSMGNPFFVEELLAADARGTPGRLRSSLREVLLGRLAVLGDGARSVVEVASVAAQPIAPAMIAALMPAGSGSLDDWLREAVENHVLIVTDKSTGELGFRHALVQEAVYEELLPGESARLHLAFGAALEAQGEPEPARRAAWWAERAHHAIAAQDQPAALVASVAAGRAAFDVAAFAAAHEHFERAIQLFDIVPDAESRVGEDRVTLIELAATGAVYAGRDARSFALRRAAISSLDATAPATRRAQLLLDLTENGLLNYDDTVAATREANALLAAEPPSALRARAEASLARELSATEQWPEALGVSIRAVQTARLARDPSVEALARVRHARSLAAVGRQADGEEEAERALALARSTRDRRILGIVFTNAARVHEGIGDMRRSAAIHDEAAGLAAELGVRESNFELFRAWNHFQIGEWDTTFAVLAEHERMAPELDNRFHTLSTLVNTRAGRYESALSHLKADAHPDDATRSVVGAEFAVWSDRPTEAAEHARAGLASESVPYQYESWKGWLFRILARAEADLAIRARRRGRAAEAAAAGDRAAWAARDLEALMAGTVSYRDRHGGELPVSLAMARAEAARAASRHDPRLWAAVADEWEVLERPFEIAYARWRGAEAILAAGGSRAEARDRLVEASSIARQLGAAPISDAVRALASRARIKLPDVPTDEMHGASSIKRQAIGATLTGREREVLALLCRGASNRQIAETLFVTESTAGVHVSNILGKLDVGSRTEAVAVAHMAGLVRPHADALSARDSASPGR